MEGRSISMDELLPGVKNILAVASGKGGVGKTTVSVNLALALSKTGAKVGLLDADVYGPSIPLMLGLKNAPEIINNKIEPVLAQGVKVISMGFFYEQSQQAGIYRGPIVAAVGMFNKLNVPIIGVIENMSYLECQHCNNKISIFGTGGGQKISEQFNVPFIGEIPLHQQIMTASDSGNPVTISETNNGHAIIFDKIARTVAGRISIIASELQDQEKSANEQPKEKEPQSVNTA
jgi:Mrp family chromosome partitioning ATPase